MHCDPKCPCCGGAEVVFGVIDDVAFDLLCPCAGGDELSVRWLLGLSGQPPPGDDWTI